MEQRNEERRRRILRRLQELASGEGVSFEDLMGTYLLGDFALRAWEQEGVRKEPDEVLRKDIARVVQEMRRIVQEENR